MLSMLSILFVGFSVRQRIAFVCSLCRILSGLHTPYTLHPRPPAPPSCMPFGVRPPGIRSLRPPIRPIGLICLISRPPPPIALPFLKRSAFLCEGVRRNALRVQCPTSPHLEDKHKHRMARPLRSRSRMAILIRVGEEVQRNALRVSYPTSPHLEEMYGT